MTDLDRKSAVGEPDWILVQESPVPSETQPEVKEFLKNGYDLVEYFAAFSPGDAHVYDQQDMFFAPFAGSAVFAAPGRTSPCISGGAVRRSATVAALLFFVGLAIVHTWPIAVAPGAPAETARPILS